MKSSIVNTLNFIFSKPDKAYADQVRLLRKEPVETIFDVGASVGQTTHKYLKLFKTARIYGFEPTPEPFEIYRRSFKRNANVVPVNSVLSDKAGETFFYRNRCNYTNSLFPAEDMVSRLCHENDSQMENEEKAVIQAITLDGFCKEHAITGMAILKMDVQGGELRVLRGSAKALARSAIKLVYCEIEFLRLYKNQPLFNDIRIFLNRFGYSFYSVYHLNPYKMATGDAIFLCPKLGAMKL